jgi:hypothetical protein
MPIDVQRLGEVVKVFNQARAWEPVRGELRALAAETLADDREMIPVVVSLIYLLLDIRDGVIPEDIGTEALGVLETAFSGTSLPSNWAELMASRVLQGGAIEDGPGPDDRLGSSLMSWPIFCDHYAASYGVSKFNEVEIEKFWSRIEQGKVEVLAEEIHLGKPNGIVWFTDESQIRSECSSMPPGGGIDANRAYDQLGLDWSLSWQKDKDGQGRSLSRAVLLSAPLSRRVQAEGGAHATTALDGWGFLAFVPGDLNRGGSWPAVGSFSVNPVDGRRSLPEGVHRRLTADKSMTCPVEGCGHVAKPVPDRLEECGQDIIARAIERL